MIEHQPGVYKLRDYLASLHEWTQENENKNPIYYYFPISSLDLAQYRDLIKWGYNNNVPAVQLLWKIMEGKRNERAS